jgi:hypothetical protein
MTKLGGQSLPLDGQRWIYVTTGQTWYEKRFHRGRVVLSPLGNRHCEIRAYRPEDDPGYGGAVLGAPYWIKTANS